jgi:hypothetical protein
MEYQKKLLLLWRLLYHHFLIKSNLISIYFNKIKPLSALLDADFQNKLYVGGSVGYGK